MTPMGEVKCQYVLSHYAHMTIFFPEPGPPGKLIFTVTSLTSLNVTWDPPAKPNGVIDIYEISYYQDIYVDGEYFGVPCKGEHVEAVT